MAFVIEIDRPGPPDVIHKVERQTSALGTGQILIRNRARAGNFATDLSLVFGLLDERILRPRITTLAIDDASEAHRRLEAGENTGQLFFQFN